MEDTATFLLPSSIFHHRRVHIQLDYTKASKDTLPDKMKSTTATTETSVASTMESLDVMPTKAKTPLSELFSFCTPKKQPMEDDDAETDEITGRSLIFEAEVPEDEEVAEEEEVKSASLFDSGLILQLGVIGAVMAVEKLL